MDNLQSVQDLQTGGSCWRSPGILAPRCAGLLTDTYLYLKLSDRFSQDNYILEARFSCTSLEISSDTLMSLDSNMLKSSRTSTLCDPADWAAILSYGNLQKNALIESLPLSPSRLLLDQSKSSYRSNVVCIRI